MINPRDILYLEDIKLLEANDIEVPDKELNDEELDNLNIKIAINLRQDDSERIIDIINDEDLDCVKYKRTKFDDRNIEKQWEDMIKEGKELLAKETPPNYVEDFIKFLNEESEKYKN